MSLSDSVVMPQKSGRIVYFDYLRVLAIFTTVGTHIMTQVWNGAAVTDFPWKVYNVFLSFFGWGVPVFTMISGALFLNPARSVDGKTLYTKNIRKIGICFCFWSAVYAVILDLRGKGVEKFLYSLFTGEFHMWFLFMIIVMYMLTPLLRRITSDHGLTAYFLKLAFLVTFVFPQVVFLLGLADIPYYTNVIQGLGQSVSSVIGYFPHYYLFYYVAGYYLYATELTPKHRKWIYALGIAGYLFTVLGTDLYSCFLNHESQLFQERNTVNVAMMSMAVFVFGKYELGRIQLSKKLWAWVKTLSDYSLGIYYVHLLIIRTVYGLLDLNERGIHPLITCLVFPVIAFMMSAFATAVMRRLPLLKNFV